MTHTRSSPRRATVARQVPSQDDAAVKVIPFPLSASQRRRNTMGVRYVECLVSGYWLQFSDESMVFDGVDYVAVTVMKAQSWTANGTPIKPRKQLELRVSRNELLRALAAVKPRHGDG
jgi:hypothetical protein